MVGPFRPGGGDPSGGNDRARPGNDTFPRGTHIFPDNAPSSGVLNSNLPSSVIPHGLSQQPGMSNVAPNNTPAPETSVSPEETSPDNLV
ncbi:hypothetical protein [Nocardia sp. alder85J]|uniref:hypothetical protein n=1 Tax=Nocardia sp. alder85J TaxID=2862949 RepID=UPI001CD20897|nr:hypothetical protein [Nocardia sp. alder85J]MCX4095479.1 hypothetical protein [Nocardia sp. alder85J]